jgi:hypothetical protein
LPHNLSKILVAELSTPVRKNNQVESLQEIIEEISEATEASDNTSPYSPGTITKKECEA